MGHIANLVFGCGFLIGGFVVGFVAYKCGFSAGRNYVKGI